MFLVELFFILLITMISFSFGFVAIIMFVIFMFITKILQIYDWVRDLFKKGKYENEKKN